MLGLAIASLFITGAISIAVSIYIIGNSHNYALMPTLTMAAGMTVIACGLLQIIFSTHAFINIIG